MVEHAINNNYTPNQKDSKTPKLSQLFSENQKELEMQHKIIVGLATLGWITMILCTVFTLGVGLMHLGTMFMSMI